MYRSAEHIGEFILRMTAAARLVTNDYELILVNDGSPDQSLSIALAAREAEPRLHIVDLTRNFGHHHAMMTGLAAATGERVFLIDSDLEEGPELLLDFEASLATSGADVVYGYQRTRKGKLFERMSGRLFYLLFNWVSRHPVPQNILTVRLMSRRYVDALLLFQESEIYFPGLCVLAGFAQTGLVVAKGARERGSYTMARRVSLFVNAVTAFTNTPLAFVFYLGCVIVSLSSAGAAILIFRKFAYGELLTGWPSLIVSVWMLGGLTIFCVGIIGIYLAKTFTEVKRRPNAIVRRTYAGDKSPGE